MTALFIQDVVMIIIAGVFIGSYQTELLPSSSIIDLMPIVIMTIAYGYIRYTIYQQEAKENEIEEKEFSSLLAERLRVK